MRALLTLAACLIVLGSGCKKPATPTAARPGIQSGETKRAPRARPVIMDDVPGRPAETTLTVNRRGAGEPDEEGWCLADSPGGGFSVKLPTLFSDFTASVQADGGRVAKIHYITAQTEGGTVYSVQAVRGVEGAPTAESQFERTLAVYGPEIKEKLYLNDGGMKGLHIRIGHPDEATLLRLYRSGLTLYTLSAAHTPGPVMPADVDREARTFLDSFRVK